MIEIRISYFVALHNTFCRFIFFFLVIMCWLSLIIIFAVNDDEGAIAFWKVFLFLTLSYFLFNRRKIPVKPVEKVKIF